MVSRWSSKEDCRWWWSWGERSGCVSPSLREVMSSQTSAVQLCCLFLYVEGALRIDVTLDHTKMSYHVSKKERHKENYWIGRSWCVGAEVRCLKSSPTSAGTERNKCLCTPMQCLTSSSMNKTRNVVGALAKVSYAGLISGQYWCGTGYVRLQTYAMISVQWDEHSTNSAAALAYGLDVEQFHQWTMTRRNLWVAINM